jgi:glutaredoxin
MGYVFKSLRWVLGQIIIAIDWLTRPSIPNYSSEKRAGLDAATASMALYQFGQCPFCVKTRRAIRRLGLNIELRDARNDPKWNAELIEQGGKYQVPCLRFENESGDVSWLYESTAINDYLDQRFG